MTITFLEETNNLIYTVDFDKYTTKKRENLSVLKRILACSQRSLQLISLFFISFKNAAWSTLISSPSSFYYYVFDGGNGSESERISMLIFRILTWVAAMGWGLSATILCLFIEKASSGHATLLKEFANDGINTEHLKTEEFELNASTVPENITVNNLVNILDAINFTDSQGPGYMPPTTRKEANRTFEPDDLRQHLHDFIRRVNTREAFLGTPPRCDFIRLMDFYQQIEDAVRLSIHKVTSDVEEFERINGRDYHSFDQKKKNEYNDLLQRRARVALDLAIAGAHCGARYMGEAMDVYYSTHGGDGQSDPENASLVSRFEQFQTLLADLKKEKVALPETEDWDDFIAELFVLDRVKEKLNILSSKTDLVEQKRWRNALKESCSKEKLGSFLVEELRKALESDTFVSIPTERYMPVCTVKAQIAEMKKVLQTRYELQINEDTLSRVLDGKTDLREAVKNSLDRDRRNAFLACLNQDQNLEEIDTNGISKELMEWLLVSQGVLTPQLKQECTKVNIDRSFSENYIEVVHQGFCNNPKTPIRSKKPPAFRNSSWIGRQRKRKTCTRALYTCLRYKWEEIQLCRIQKGKSLNMGFSAELSTQF